MKYILMMLMLLPLNLWAAWDVDLTLGVDGETYKAEQQKLEEGKETSVNMGRYILKLTLKTNKLEKSLDVFYTLQEKKDKQMVLITKGDDAIEKELTKEIFAKGEVNQPNTIITLKFKSL